MKIIKIIRIIKYLKIGTGLKTIDEIEKCLYDFYKIKGCLD